MKKVVWRVLTLLLVVSMVFPMGVTVFAAPEDANLESLSINGVSVEGFDPNTTEYTVNIASTQTRVTVEYTTTDSDAQVELVQPASYYDPFKLVVTAGSETKTYTITCRTANDLVDNLTYDAGVPETKDSRSAVFKHALQELDPAFSDRTGQGTGAAAALVQLNDLSEELLGRDYLLAPYTWTRDHGSLWKKSPTDAGYIEKWMQFDMHRSGTVKIYAASVVTAVEQAYKADGWTVAENSDGYFKALGANGNTTNIPFTRCYTKHVTVGENPENLYIRGGSGNFIVLFEFDGYEVEDDVQRGGGSTLLESLKINGTEAPAFDPRETAYTVNIASAQTRVTVEYTPADKNARVKLIQPASYYDPFKLVVTNAEGKSRTYEITCRTANDLVDNLTYDEKVPASGNDKTHANRTTTFKHALQELDPAFSDRTGRGSGVEAALVQLNDLPEELLGRDYLLAPVQWQRDDPNGLWKLKADAAGYIEKWLRYDMHRSGTVKIYAASVVATVEQAYKADGWTIATNSDGHFKALGANGNTMNVSFTRCYTKHFTVGENPENLYIRGGSGNFIVLFEFDGYYVEDLSQVQEEIYVSHVELTKNSSDNTVTAQALVYGGSSAARLFCAAYSNADGMWNLEDVASANGMNTILETKPISVGADSMVRAYVWKDAANEPISEVATYYASMENVLDTLTITSDNPGFNSYIASNFDSATHNYSYQLNGASYPNICASVTDSRAEVSVENTEGKTVITVRMGREVTPTRIGNAEVGFDKDEVSWEQEEQYTISWIGGSGQNALITDFRQLDGVANDTDIVVRFDRDLTDVTIGGTIGTKCYTLMGGRVNGTGALVSYPAALELSDAYQVRQTLNYITHDPRINFNATTNPWLSFVVNYDCEVYMIGNVYYDNPDTNISKSYLQEGWTRIHLGDNEISWIRNQEGWITDSMSMLCVKRFSKGETVQLSYPGAGAGKSATMAILVKPVD